MSEKQEEFKVIDHRTQHNPGENLPARQEPNAVIMEAIRKNMDPAFIEKLMELQERAEANQARREYNEALARFKQKAPQVKKDKFNPRFKSYYTSIGNLLDTLNPYLAAEGLSVSFPVSKQDDKSMTVECRLSHSSGHYDSISIAAPIDKAAIGRESGQASRNAMQDLKSTFTYLRSATCEAMLGVAGTEASAIDDDGNASGKDSGPSLFEQWETRFIEASEASKTVNEMAEWWKANGPAVKKDLKKAAAARIFDMVVKAKDRMKKAEPEREPGQEG